MLRPNSWAHTCVPAATSPGSKAHRHLLLEGLGLPADCDYPIHDRFGNTGSAALPLSLALGAQEGNIPGGTPVALLGIGSGLNSLMLGLEWGTMQVQGTTRERWCFLWSRTSAFLI